MSLAPAHYVMAIGRHHAVNNPYESSAASRRKLAAIAASQAGKQPRRHAGLCLSMLLLTYLQAVGSSMQRPGKIPAAQHMPFQRNGWSRPDRASEYAGCMAAACGAPLRQHAPAPCAVAPAPAPAVAGNASASLAVPDATAIQAKRRMAVSPGRNPVLISWSLPLADAAEQSSASRFQWRWLVAGNAISVEDEWSNRLLKFVPM